MRIDKDKVVFLLGGHDLEMVTIRELLGEYEVKDKSLTWSTAELSAYGEELEETPDKIFYAVELNVDDTSLLDKYNIKIIDHHGDEHNGKPASILQVLDLLGVKKEDISRDQELIAANDARYIDGMKCMGATTDEIVDIRQKDRRAQGVIKSDEIACKNDAKSKKIENGIAIVCATADKFSVITDSLYFDFPEEDRQSKAIIYNDKKIVLYGFDLSELKETCKKLNILESDYYFGGGNGYFGIKDGTVDKITREKIIAILVEKEKNEIYSSHTFMFPFRFDYVPNSSSLEKKHEYKFYSEKDIEARIDLKKLYGQLSKHGWDYEKFEIKGEEKHLLYSDFSYFYDYARVALYNDNPSPDTSEISTFFRKNKECYGGKKYTIDILQKSSHKASIYNLDIVDITLRVFHTGVAILSIELDNYSYSSKRDILRINDYGRRIYPQFIGKNMECATKEQFLPNYIQIGDDEKENFSNLDYGDITIGKHILQVLGSKLFTGNKKNAEGIFYIQPSLDDRMFVLSWYGNNGFSEKMKIDECYRFDDSWYEYIFVDNSGATVQNRKMKKKLIKNSTYDRWSNYGTLFGVTRYSFVGLTASDWFGKNIIVNHMRTMYFQMMILLLATRTSILRLWASRLTPPCLNSTHMLHHFLQQQGITAVVPKVF